MKQDANAGSQSRGLTTANALPRAGPPYLTSQWPREKQQALQWGLGESEHVGGASASFLPYGPGWAEAAGPPASRHTFTLGPHGGQVG